MTKVRVGDEDALLIKQYKALQATNPMNGMSPEEVDGWILANITDLASAKVALRHVGKILAMHDLYLDVLARQIYHLDKRLRELE